MTDCAITDIEYLKVIAEKKEEKRTRTHTETFNE